MIDDLKRFVTFVDIGSVTKAAEKLHITQPALSLSIARLEKELHVQIFSHKKKQLIITPAGDQVYAVAKKMVELWEKAKQPTVYPEAKTTIAIGTYDNAALRLASYFQKHLTTRHIELNIKISASTNLIRDLIAGVLDIAVAVMDKEEELPKHAVLVSAFTEELIPVAKEKLTLPVEQMPFILYNQGSKTRAYIDSAFAEYGMLPHVIAESSSTSFMKALAMAGSGVTLLPKNAVADELRTKQLIRQRIAVQFVRKAGVFIKQDADELVEKIAQDISKRLI